MSLLLHPAFTDQLILASGSQVRIKMLHNAGLVFETIPAQIDERALETSMLESGCTAQEIGQALAIEKARFIAQKNPDALVIGADQILIFEGKIYSKPQDLDEARIRLKSFAGKTHQLLSAGCIMRNDELLWQASDEVNLQMRAVDDAFIDRYIQACGEDVLSSVGAYKIEEEGSWLFEKIDGDFFTVLGFPLLPFLGYLQDNNFLVREIKSAAN